jgi:fibro-slime domain-containing protein
MKLAPCLASAALALLACSSGGGNTGGGGSGTGAGSGTSTGTGTGGDFTIITDTATSTDTGTGTGTGTDCGALLKGIIRDFSPTTHPDFENATGDDRGIVSATLGADHKPVYAGNPTTPTTHGQMYFDEWYRDTAGVNQAIAIDIPLTAGPGGVYTYDNQAFFPIDGQGFGDEGNPHNYHFTLEVHTQFQYRGGEVFTFTGDDDLFTFINGKLALNLGGVHGAETSSVSLDAAAADLGIQVGGIYALDMFFAERHTVDSHFRVDTTIGCFTPVEVPQ